MQRCLQLAQLGAGHVAPNPKVGAVLVYNDTIIGEGYHQRYGQAHAEVNCINSVLEKHRQLIDKSTLYVSLEPCAHFGKTPPCTALIIKMNIPKVIVGCRDSYKEVNGKGIDDLRNAGIDVTVGVMEWQSKNLNKRFFTFHAARRPYIILKWAQSSNAKIAHADFSSVRISNDYTNRLVHKWRSEEAGIMVATNTALHDNPALTNRYWAGNSPVRIVIDKALKLPTTHQLISDGLPTIIFNSIKNDEQSNVIYKKINQAESFLPELLACLYQMNIQSVLVEGGAALLQSFIDTGLWDEARIITNTDLMINNGIAAPLLHNAQKIQCEKFFSDTIYYYNRTTV